MKPFSSRDISVTLALIMVFLMGVLVAEGKYIIALGALGILIINSRSIWGEE